MRVWRLRVRSFRGIKSLDWTIASRTVCLVGPGDATKSTILDALSLATSSRSTLNFVDKDFYQGKSADGFELEVTIGELPQELLRDTRFGLELRGVLPDGTVIEEPGDEAPVLTIRFAVGEDLDPTWSVISAANPEGRPIGPRDRALLSVRRVGDEADRQFSWARNTALARALGPTEDISGILAAAYRAARDAVAVTDLSQLDQSVDTARLAATQVGVGRLADTLEVRLDVSPTSGQGLSLHSGSIPASSLGLGTRRLLALGLELYSTAGGSVVAIDEIEHGLEPHRVRQLLAALRVIVATQGQVIYTTHSPIPLEELGAEGVHVVRNNDGDVHVAGMPGDFVDIVRGSSAALLARKVIVAEGRTEIGLVRGVATSWPASHGSRPLTHQGVEFVDGGGCKTAPARALRFRELGFPCLVLADSDEPLVPSGEQLATAGCVVVEWAGEMCTEERIAADVSMAVLGSLFNSVIDGGVTVQAAIGAIVGSSPGAAACERMGGAGPPSSAATLEDLLTLGFSEMELRAAFGAAAHKKGWFKTIDGGTAMGRLVASDPSLATSALGQQLAVVEKWVYDD